MAKFVWVMLDSDESKAVIVEADDIDEAKDKVAAEMAQYMGDIEDEPHEDRVAEALDSYDEDWIVRPLAEETLL